MISLIEEVRTWPSFSREEEILESYRPVIHRIYQNWCNVTDEDFAVLSHGDLHKKNIMFQHAEGSTSPTDAIFVSLILEMESFKIFFFFLVGLSACILDVTHI